MNLKRLEFTLTRRCNSRCVHCQADASPLRKERMDVGDAKKWLVEAAEIADLRSFMVFGGEPMLYPERAVAVFAEAKRLGIPVIEMLTNGSWSMSLEKAEKLAAKLKDAGLNTLGISVDAFHIEHIPLDRPLNAALAALRAGVEQVTWNVTVIESLDAENEYDKKTKQILNTLEPTGVRPHVHRILPVGRAARNLRQYFPAASLEGPCTTEPFTNESLKNPESICIEPSGSVNICWDLEIGNAKQKPLSRILSEYDWRKNPLTKTLMQSGPKGLLKLPELQSFELHETQYVHKCHLCIEARRVLRARGS